METILRTILYEWRERELPNIIKRDEILNIEANDDLHKATIVTGFRRSGKTYLLFEAIKRLLNRHSKEEVMYINFEDARIPLKTVFLTYLLPRIQAVFGKKPTFLFLDEIQNIPLWSKWLRRVLDTEKIKIYITGSSSKMSSFELPTELRGRAWEVKVFPLSFSEFLRFKNILIDLEKIKYLPEEKAKFNFAFDEFLLYGSLPEVVLTTAEKKQDLLQTYFQTVVRKEIIERFKVRNEEGLKTMLKLLINSTLVTSSKLYNNLKSLGLAVGKTTVNTYLSYTESSYFLKQLYYYSPSMRNQLQYPRKLYLIDNGFITALSSKFSKNYGRLFENYIFWHLKKKHDDLFYYKDERGKEVDFVVRDNGRITTLYQVCYDMTDFETKEREIKNLILAGKKLGCKKLILVSRDKEKETKTIKGIKLLTTEDLYETEFLKGLGK